MEGRVPFSYGLQEMAAAGVTTATVMDILGVFIHCLLAARHSAGSSHGTANDVPLQWQSRIPVEPTWIR